MRQEYKGFAPRIVPDRRKVYSLHISHPEQGEVSIKYSVVKSTTWERCNGKAIAIGRLIMEYLNTPCETRLLYLQDSDVLGDQAEQLIPLTDASGKAWAGFVAVLKIPKDAPNLEDGSRGIVLTTRVELMGPEYFAVDAYTEYRRAIASGTP